MSVDAVQSRTGIVTFKGKPMTLLGPQLRVGDPAPPFELTAGDLSSVNLDTLSDDGNRAALLIAVPSLDTPVCSLESQEIQCAIGRTPVERTRGRR